MAKKRKRRLAGVIGYAARVILLVAGELDEEEKDPAAIKRGEKVGSVTEQWRLAERGRLSPNWRIGHWSHWKLIFLWVLVGLVLWVVNNLLTSPPSLDGYTEGYAGIMFYLMVLILVCALFMSVGILIFTRKWLRERKSLGHPKLSN